MRLRARMLLLALTLTLGSCGKSEPPVDFMKLCQDVEFTKPQCIFLKMIRDKQVEAQNASDTMSGVALGIAVGSSAGRR